MNTRLVIVLLATTIFLSGCATTTRSTLLGAAIGGTVGGLLGQAQSHNSKGTANGMAIGAGVGGLLGYLSHKDKKEVKDGSNPAGDEYNFPALTKPKLRSVWVPDKVEGNKYIRGHWIYVIEDAGSWSRD